MTSESPAWVSINSGDVRAEIDPKGAQLSILRDADGRDLMWNGDPAIWAGRAPLLFPIVGVLAGGRYRLGSRSYALSRHGFARDRIFSVEARDASSATFRLHADESTRALYPFEFQLDVRYACSESTLAVSATIRNLNDAAMPASIGFHPAFLWPLPFAQPRAAHLIEFESDEPASVRRIDAAGLLRPERQTTPIVNRRLALDDDLFENDVLILDQVRSRSVSYGAGLGPRIRVNFPDAPFLGIWSKPGAPFVCIEPWHGITDLEGFAGDFSKKPGVFLVPAAGAFETRMDITLLKG